MRILSILSCASPENSKFNSYSFSISVFSFKISEEVSLLSVVVVAEARSFFFHNLEDFICSPVTRKTMFKVEANSSETCLFLKVGSNSSDIRRF
jgi:hypothetical protein